MHAMLRACEFRQTIVCEAVNYYDCLFEMIRRNKTAV